MYCMPVVNFRSDRINLHCLLNQLVAQSFLLPFQFPPSAAKLLPKSRRITCTLLVSIFFNSKNGNLFRDIWLQVLPSCNCLLFYSFIYMCERKLQNHKQGSLEQCLEFLPWISIYSYSMPAHHKSYCVSKQTGYSRWRWCDLCFSINMPFNTICGLLEEKTLKTQQSPDNSSEGYCSDPSPIFMCKLFWKLEFISCWL